MLEAEDDSRLASALGIKLDELYETIWDIQSDVSKDGMLYGYSVYFDEESNPKVLEKLGVLGGGYVSLSHDAFYSEVDEESYWELRDDLDINHFRSQLSNITDFLQQEVRKPQEFSYFVMLYLQLAASLEYLLYRVFLKTVTGHDNFKAKFIESDDEFKEREIKLSQIFRKYAELDITIANRIKQILFHDTKKVISLYSSVLGFQFGDARWLSKLMSERHDCAHRVGHNKDGVRLDISKRKISKIIKKCNSLADDLECKLNEIAEQVDNH